MQNAWVKYTIQHGPGHQSTSICYVYFWCKILREDIEEQADQICDQWDNALAKWEIVRKLPYSVKKRLINRYLQTIKNAQDMLKILNETHTLTKDISARELQHLVEV
jgi:hypothetical protein